MPETSQSKLSLPFVLPLKLQTISGHGGDAKNGKASDSILAVAPAMAPDMLAASGASLDANVTAVPNDLVQAFSGIGQCSRNSIPWNEIAEWTHSLEKTPTDQWMDLFRGRFHRTYNHHPVDFLNAWITEKAPNLHIGDYVRHLALDAITTDGLPLLGSEWHQALESIGITSKFLHQWTHLNAFDVTFGYLSAGSGASTLALALTGNLPWEGSRTMLITFGGGAVDLAVGCALKNPFMVAGGAMRVSSGCISLWQHWHMPVIEPAMPTLLDILAPALLHGAEAGALGGVLRLALGWRAWSPQQRGLAVAESLAVSSSAAALGVLTPWLSIPAAFAYGLGKFAWRIAGDDSQFWLNTSLTSPSAFTASIDSLIQNGGPEAVASLQSFFEQGRIAADAVAPADLAIESAWLELPEDARAALACDAGLRPLDESGRIALQPRPDLFVSSAPANAALAPVSLLPPVLPT